MATIRSPRLSLAVLPYKLAIAKLNKNARIPLWAMKSPFFSITRASDEISIVCPVENIPSNVMSERNWRAIRIRGKLKFSLTGILASILDPLARAKISVFALSTYNTDYVLVSESDIERAVKVLSKHHNIRI
jgi:hypothetical protein